MRRAYSWYLYGHSEVNNPLIAYNTRLNNHERIPPRSFFSHERAALDRFYARRSKRFDADDGRGETLCWPSGWLSVSASAQPSSGTIWALSRHGSTTLFKAIDRRRKVWTHQLLSKQCAPGGGRPRGAAPSLPAASLSTRVLTGRRSLRLTRGS